jgi:hypothetical protein
MPNVLSRPVTPTTPGPSNPCILQSSISIRSCRPCSVSPSPSPSTHRSPPPESPLTTPSRQARRAASRESCAHETAQAPNARIESDSNWTILPLGPFGDANEGRLALQVYAHSLGYVVTIENTAKMVRSTVIQSIDLACDRRNKRRGKQARTNARVRPDKSNGCKWRVKIYRCKDSSYKAAVFKEPHHHTCCVKDLMGNATFRRQYREQNNLEEVIKTAVERLSHLFISSSKIADYLSGSLNKLDETDSGSGYENAPWEVPPVDNPAGQAAVEIVRGDKKLTIFRDDVKNIQLQLKTAQYSAGSSTSQLLDLLKQYEV